MTPLGDPYSEKSFLKQEEKVFNNLSKWQVLQELLKEEITLNEKINTQKKIDIENLKRNYFTYYDSKLKVKQAYENFTKLFSYKKEEDLDKINPSVKLENNLNDFGDIELRIQTLLNTIRNNYTNLILIIENLSEDNKNEVADFFAHFFFENILIQNPEYDELLIFSYLLLEKEINDLYTSSIDSFLEFSFMGRFLKSICRRLDIKNYLSLALKDLIYELENQSENFMDIDLNIINDRIKNDKIDRNFFSNYDLEKIRILYENNKNLGLAYNIRVSTLNNFYYNNNTKNSNDTHINSEEILQNDNDIKENDNIFKESLQKNNNINKENIPFSESNNIISYDKLKPTLDNKGNIINNNRIFENKIYLIKDDFNKKEDKHTTVDMNEKIINSDNSSLIENNELKNEENNNIEKEISSIKHENTVEDDINHDYKFDITEQDIMRRYIQEKDFQLKNYYMNLFKQLASDSNIFSNKNLFNKISSYGDDELLPLFIYKINFEKIKCHVDKFIFSIIENASSIPYLVKCICKIIHILISKKFPNLTIYEKNSFIGKFLFGRCIMPTIINPDYNGIIYSHIISGTTRKNLKNINKILGRIYKATLFDSNIDPNYTIFNCYLLEIFPTLNKFYNYLITVKFSEKIQQLVNIGSERFMDLKENNQLYYFENYPEQIYNIQCVCFTYNIIFTICKIIKENKKGTDKNNFTSLCETIYNNLRSKRKNLMEENSNINKYYLHFNESINPKYKEELFIKASKFTFSENENLEKENITSKVKFCIKKILKSINMINPRVYSSLAEADNTQKFFIGLDKIIELEDNSESINTIPLNWYSMYMTNYFSLLSDEYKKNNFSLLFEELLKEAILEIDKLKSISNTFNSKLGMNLRCSEKLVENAKRDSIKMKNIENYIRIEKFMHNTKIKVCIRICPKKETTEDMDLPSILITPTENCIHQSLYYVGRLVNGKKPKIKKNNFTFRGSNNRVDCNVNARNLESDTKKLSKNNLLKTSDLYNNSSLDNSIFYNSNTRKSLFNFTNNSQINFINYNSNNSTYKNENTLQEGDFGECHCENIFEFIREFQNFSIIKDDIIRGEAENKIGESLSKYLKIIYSNLDNEKLFSNYDTNGKINILNDIENYILRKMYKNVFPEELLDNDIKFNLQCIKFSWVQPKHLEIKNKLINEVLWQQGIRILIRLDYEKSPLDKLNCVQSVLKIIKNSINFCLCENENFTGADDQNPIFIYMVLKANLKKYITNINYIMTFIHDENKTNYYGQTLALMDFSKNYILGMDRDYFKNLSDQEFDKLMINSAKSITNKYETNNIENNIRKKRGLSIYANDI